MVSAGWELRACGARDLAGVEDAFNADLAGYADCGRVLLQRVATGCGGVRNYGPPAALSSCDIDDREADAAAAPRTTGRSATPMADYLSKYRAKRDFKKTSEPSGEAQVKLSNRRRFVIQKHDATRLHYDLRLELEGVFKSWAVTKGPSLDPHNKRLAVEVGSFARLRRLRRHDPQGPVWRRHSHAVGSRGYWEPEGRKSPEEALKKGDFKFTLHGKRLQGSFVLVRMRNDRDGGKRTNWLLIKHHDEHSVEENGAKILEENATSVASGRSMEQIAESSSRSWDSKAAINEDRLAGDEARVIATQPYRNTGDFLRCPKPLQGCPIGQRRADRVAMRS